MDCERAPVAVQTFGGPVGTDSVRFEKSQSAYVQATTVLFAGLIGEIADVEARSPKQGIDPMPLVASQQSASAFSASAEGSLSDIWAWWSV